MALTMYAFDPTGHSHEIPGVDVHTMNDLLLSAKGNSRQTIHIHDVTDRDGRPHRVIVVMLCDFVFDTFDFPTER